MARSFGGPKGKQSPPAIRRALFALAVAGPPGVLPDAERWRRMSTRSAVLNSRCSRNLSPAPLGNCPHAGLVEVDCLARATGRLPFGRPCPVLSR